MTRFHPGPVVARATAPAILLLVAVLAAPRPGAAATASTIPAAPATGALFAPLWLPRAPVGESGEREGVNAERETEARFFRGWAGGDLAPDAWQRMWEQALARPSEPAATATAAPHRAGAPAKVAAVNTWQLLGPVFSTNVGGGLMTGRVRDVDPANVRVLAASGGLWRFNILTAVPMSDSVAASWFGSFASNPGDPNLILLGTGEWNGQVGTGLYRTTDGGATWTRPINQFYRFSRVRWAPDAVSAYAACDQGFFRSTNSGVTWSRTLVAQVSDFAIVPQVPGLLFATGVNSGIFRSTDGGATWSMLTGGGAPQGALGQGAIGALRVASLGQTWVYAAFNNRIWRSTDAGDTWTEVTPGFPVSDSGYGPAISVCPNDGNTVLYGNVGYMRTVDGGANWTKITTPHLHADYHVFGWDPNGDGVWAGHDGGWSHSLDRGATWTSSSNIMPVSQFYDVDCVHDGPGLVIGGTQDNNVLYTPNSSVYWIDPALGSTEGDAMGVAVDPYNPNQLWAVSGVSGGPISFPRYRSTDGGTNWTAINNGMLPTGWGGQIVTDNAFPARLFTNVTNQVLESTDGGNTWVVSNLVAFPNPTRSLHASTRVAGGAVLWATLNGLAGSGQQLYVRDNGTWYERSAGLSGTVIDAVPHPWAANADEAWAITNSPGARLWHTLNRGLSWTNVSGDLPLDLMLAGFVPNPRHSGEWYVGTAIGVWRTKNNGINWERWSNGMPPGAIVTDLTYSDQTTTNGQFWVVAGTYGRSVWKREVGGEDPFPTVQVSSPVIQEGDSGQKSAVFRATLSAPQGLSVTVGYATADGSATAGLDYVATSGTLAFVPGATIAYATVPVLGDVSVESNETFSLVFSNALRTTAPAPATCTIQDDDASDIVCHDLYVTNGAVNAIAASGNTVYVGGNFTSAGPATGSGVPLDLATGGALHLPRINGQVLCAAPDGSGGWYVGGSFTYVGGQPRSNLAHLHADGSLDAWNPSPNGYVQALAVSGNTLYVGGAFTVIGGLPRQYLAAVPSYGNEPGDWAPEPDGQVYALCLSGNTLYVGGDFTHFMGVSRNRAAASSTLDGSLLPWNPNAGAEVFSIAADAGGVWVVGAFTSIGGQTRNKLAALDATTGLATAWNPAPDGDPYAVATAGGPVYVCGAFTNIGGQPRPYLAALDRATGFATAWSPAPNGIVSVLAATGGTVYAGGGFSTIGGQARNGMGAVGSASALASAWNPAANGGASVIVPGATSVFVGGSFTSLGAQPRGSIAAYDAATGALRAWDPQVSGAVYALAAGGGVVYAGGSFTSAGGQPRNRLAAFDSTSAAVTAWDPNASSTVRCMLLSGSRVYVGGQFTSVSATTRNRAASISTGGTLQSWNPNANSTVSALATDGTYIYAGGGFTSIGGQARNALAQLSTTGGTASAWNPNVAGPVTALLSPDASTLYVGGLFNTIAGLARPNLALINLANATVASWTPAPNDQVTSLAPAPASGQVYVGGQFTQIAGVARDHLALLRVSTGQVASWAPQPDGNVNALVASGSTLWIGGGFQTIGNLPKANVSCAIPQALVDVPDPSPSGAFVLHLSPNPSAGRVVIEYELPAAARVTIAVYDVAGRRVGPGTDEWQVPGAHRTTWDGMRGRGLEAGVYFVHLAAGGRQAVKRFVVL